MQLLDFLLKTMSCILLWFKLSFFISFNNMLNSVHVLCYVKQPRRPIVLLLNAVAN